MIEGDAMLISAAYAQGAGQGGGAEALQAFLPIILIFVVFYFLLIRPQQKRMKEQREMLAAIRRGDRIVLGGGIIGTVQKVIDDAELLVEIAEGVRVRVQRAMVATVLAKGDAPKTTDSTDGGGNSAEAAPPAAAPKGGIGRFFGNK
jgi:preprotein translocase subunit YajC